MATAPQHLRADRAVIAAIFALSAMGVVAVYSAVAFLADTKAGGDATSLLFRHVMHVGLALGAAAVLLLAGRGRRATGYLRWPVALALLGLGLHYGVTIINL